MTECQPMLCPAGQIHGAARERHWARPEAPRKREESAEFVAITDMRSIRPQEAVSAVMRRNGAMLDVREGTGLQPLGLDHYRIALADIERFIAGRLSGEQVQDFVSMLIFLAEKWRAIYVVAGTDEDGRAAVRHLARLGFTDSAVVVGGASGLRLTPG